MSAYNYPQNESRRKAAAAGFTLIEILIVVVIISILLAIAYPAYTKYVQDARQEAGRALLLDWASALEGYRGKHFSYNGASSMTGTLVPESVGHKHYKYTISVPSDHKYTIKATPYSAIMSGTETMVLDSQGNACAAVGGCTPSSSSSW
ncbi:secretion protein [Alcanivorax jadensis T9]|uniref:Secretion protein n=1 Tax=Alcanivorax jadensis T9 TaxID=1177181 RepID=A0ABR4W9F4_9GAMM|nr:type IV pilin protein [Alcanivorax jadensis]KGD60039.1 secretion protein [Alcanivorax jadensis T9]